MKEPVEWLDHRITTLAESVKGVAFRCHSLVGEVERHMNYHEVNSAGHAAQSTDPMKVISRSHARQLVHDLRVNLLPSLDNLAYVTDLQRLRTQTCRQDVASNSAYARASDLRHRRLGSKNVQVLNTDSLAELLELCGKGLIDIHAFVNNQPPSLPAAARNGTLGKSKAGRLMSDALQERLFQWSVQREARVLADSEIHAAVSAPSSTLRDIIDGVEAAPSPAYSPPTTAHLRALVATQQAERASLSTRIEEERQLLINEQAFVDNLLSDVDTLEGVLESIHYKADDAEEVLRKSFYKMETAIARESDQTLQALEAERTTLLASIESAKESVAEVQRTLHQQYQQHPAHAKITHLQQSQLRPTLAMLKFAFDERRQVSSNIASNSTIPSLADEVNDPLARLWLRGELPHSASLPSVMILQDLDTGAFLQCARGANGVSVMPLGGAGNNFQLRSENGDARVHVKFLPA